ncbi:hypothetical protein DQ04_15361000 [Trypanosoma grayi]|uniref:hypothetical protein n=1 Tax=Trypanosoma grayi TaxID=71804 RepID=UPI0004F4AF9D|nr:hypothetical protein DQ04_15361000 [Trypanosoma grayi]KEG06191.1 hypothetical protein DQ04_15361000 [Trypanosoma grayi]
MTMREDSSPPAGADILSPAARSEFTTTSFLSTRNGDHGAAGSRYYDANLEWVPTVPLRWAAHRWYPQLQSGVHRMEACGRFFVQLLGLDESRYDYVAEGRRERRQRQRRRINGDANGNDDNDEEEEEEEEEVVELHASEHGQTSGVVPVFGRNSGSEFRDVDDVDTVRRCISRSHCETRKKVRRTCAPLRGFPIGELPEEQCY